MTLLKLQLKQLPQPLRYLMSHVYFSHFRNKCCPYIFQLIFINFYKWLTCNIIQQRKYVEYFISIEIYNVI